MHKLNTQQIADLIVQTTVEYTTLFFENGFGRKNEDGRQVMDKQIWATLHTGFATGMQQHGYTEKELAEATELAQDEIARIETSR